MRKLFGALAITMMAFTAPTGVIAGDDQFGLSPAACEEAVVHYLDDRLYDSRSARVHLSSDPYKVQVAMRGATEVSAWAVDILVKSRLPTGSWSSYQNYTVIFQDGAPVALESDVQSVTAI